MALKFTIFAAEESDRQQLEAALLATGRASMAGRALALPVPFQTQSPLDPQLRALQAQNPEAVIIELPAAASGVEAALALVAWLHEQTPLASLMVVGPMDPPQLIVQAMRAGATEYLEKPVRAAALEEALTRCSAARSQGQ